MVEQLYSLYLALNAIPQQILLVLQEPDVEIEHEAQVFSYLKKFIGSVKNEEVHRFLRLITGSSMLLHNGITVCFNSNSGMICGPIAHRTCSSLLELPIT